MSTDELKAYVELAAALEPIAEKLIPEVADKVVMPILNGIEDTVSKGFSDLFGRIRNKAAATVPVQEVAK